jgi:hypothetical protein
VKPLVIDLFCGLLPKIQFGWHENPLVNKLVTCGAQNPDHVQLGVLYFTPRSVSFIFRSVSYFKNPAFSARLTRLWKLRIFALKSNEQFIRISPSGIVKFLNVRILDMKRLALSFGRYPGALLGTISSIARGLNNFKMFFANSAVPSVLGDVGLFATPKPAESRTTFRGAILLVWPLSGKTSVAHFAE